MSIEFLLTSLIVVLLPGTGVIYTLAIGLDRGFKASVAAADGCTFGIVPAAAASIVGLAGTRLCDLSSRSNAVDATPVCGNLWVVRFATCLS